MNKGLSKMAKTVKSVNLDNANRDLVKEEFHKFGFPNFSQTLNAILTAIRVSPNIKKEIESVFMRGLRE